MKEYIRRLLLYLLKFDLSRCFSQMCMTVLRYFPKDFQKPSENGEATIEETSTESFTDVDFDDI